MKYTAALPNVKSFQVRVIEYDGTNIQDVCNFIKQYGIELQSVSVIQEGINNNALYLLYVHPWNKANEEEPQKGDKYTIHPDRSCHIYTAGEFEANFKPVPEEPHED